MGNYLEKLNELIALKKVKGHKINKTESDDFSRAWKSLVTAEGSFSDLAEQYFYDGFIFTGARPFIDWVVSSDDQFAALNSLFKGALFERDTVATFRILISLLANLLTADIQDKRLLFPVIKRIPAASKNKEKKTIGDGHKILAKYFIGELNCTTTYPDLSELDIKPAFINDFKALMDELLSRIDFDSLSKKDSATAIAVTKWLHPANEQIDGAMDKKPAMDQKVPAQDGTATIVVQESNTSTTAALEKTLDPYEILYDALKKAAEISTQLQAMRKVAENKIVTLSDANSALHRDMASLDTQLESAKRRENDLSVQLAERNQRISVIIAEKKELEHRIQLLQSTISEKESEIVQRTQMMEALSRDRAKQSDEQTKRLASKLKIEYRDFLDAERLPMDSDLGENMREQLKNIFGILIKAGIAMD